MTLSIIPDVNVWVALNYKGHIHNELSVAWFYSLDEGSILHFCRQTQLGFFRLLTNTVAMLGEARTQRECWALYEYLIEGGRVKMMAEPYKLERYFKACTSSDQSSPKVWADAYLASFAEAANLTLVTFDRALAAKVNGAVLLG